MALLAMVLRFKVAVGEAEGWERVYMVVRKYLNCTNFTNTGRQPLGTLIAVCPAEARSVFNRVSDALLLPVLMLLLLLLS